MSYQERPSRSLEFSEDFLYYTEQEGREDTCLIFPGQGSFSAGKDRELIQEATETVYRIAIQKLRVGEKKAREMVRRFNLEIEREVGKFYFEADDILQEDRLWDSKIGTKIVKDPQGKEKVIVRSIRDLTDEELVSQELNQPATFLFNEVSRLADERVRRFAGDPPIRIRYIAGNSLGLYNALYRGGAFRKELRSKRIRTHDEDYDDGLRNALNMVKIRGRTMQVAFARNPGGLIAITMHVGREGPTEEQKKALRKLTVELKKRNKTYGFKLHLEAENSDNQVVFGSKPQDLENAKTCLAENYGSVFKVTPLPVRGVPHSPLMKPAQRRFTAVVKGYLRRGQIKDLDIPVVANTTATPIRKGKEVAEEMIHHLTEPVLWRQSMEFVEGDGIKAILDVHTKKTLSNMMRHKLKYAGVGAGLLAGLGVGLLVLKKRR